MVYQLFSIVAIIFLLSSCGSKKHLVYPVSNVKPVPYPTMSIDQDSKKNYLGKVNEARAKGRMCGSTFYAPAKPLAWHSALYRAAYEHSQDMAKNRTMRHDGSGTKYDWTAKKQNLKRSSRLVDRIENNGYVRHKGVAENIAYGTGDFGDVMQQWIHSEGHCRNIMNPAYSDFGMAEVKSVDSVSYWTQNFGISQ